MFKIIILDSTSSDVLDQLQAQYDILDVREIGFDTNNKYLLVQYGTKTEPSPPSPSGSMNSGSAG